MKKMEIRYIRPDKQFTHVAIKDLYGKLDGRILILSPNSLRKLLIKILYWNLNSYQGEAWGDALCYAVIVHGKNDIEERRIDEFKCDRSYYDPRPVHFADRMSDKDRSVEFVEFDLDFER